MATVAIVLPMTKPCQIDSQKSYICILAEIVENRICQLVGLALIYYQYIYIYELQREL